MLVSVGLVLGVSACLGGSPSRSASAAPGRADPNSAVPSSADAPPRAPGLAVDPLWSPPPVSREAHTGRGVVTLQAPLPTSEAQRLVAELFAAMLLEDEDLVARLLDEEAFTRTSTGGARSPARSSWITRMSRLDYRALGGRQLFRAADMELFRGAPSLGERPGAAPNSASGRALSAPRGLPLEPTGEDVVLRVPLRVTRAGAERLFADELWFLLAPSGGGYRIREIVEDFTLP